MKKKTSILIMVTLVLSTFLFASVKIFAKTLTTPDDLAKAKKEGKTVFLIITGTGTYDLTNSEKIAKEASQKVKNSVIIKLNKDESVNSAAVSKMGIAGVPVPFILVISPKGVPVLGGTPEQVSVDQLVKSIPSPKQDEALAALYNKKPVFIIISKKGFTDHATLLSNCKTASSKIASKPSIIEININDANEQTFLKKIGVPSLNGKTKVVVANATGQITSTFEGNAEVADLISSANKVIKSGGCCSSGGCGSSCKK